MPLLSRQPSQCSFASNTTIQSKTCRKRSDTIGHKLTIIKDYAKPRRDVEPPGDWFLYVAATFSSLDVQVSRVFSSRELIQVPTNQ